MTTADGTGGTTRQQGHLRRGYGTGLRGHNESDAGSELPSPGSRLATDNAGTGDRRSTPRASLTDRPPLAPPAVGAEVARLARIRSDGRDRRRRNRSDAGRGNRRDLQRLKPRHVQWTFAQRHLAAGVAPRAVPGPPAVRECGEGRRSDEEQGQEDAFYGVRLYLRSNVAGQQPTILPGSSWRQSYRDATHSFLLS